MITKRRLAVVLGLLAGIACIAPVTAEPKPSEEAADMNGGGWKQELSDEFIADWTAAEEEESADDPNDQAMSLVIEEETSGPIDKEGPEASQRVRVTLFKIRGWPEFKVENRRQCRRVFGRRICVNVPQAFQRNCEMVAFAEVRHPKANTIKAKIETCVKQAVAAGVLAGVYTGDLGVAAAALEAYLKSCLAATGVEQLGRVAVTVRTEKKCGRWRPR